MPPLPGFSDNPFRTRADFVRAAYALLRPLEPYKSDAKARIKLAASTAAGFDDVAAQLEGFARPLWAVAPLVLHESGLEDTAEPNSVNFGMWFSGLEAGVDPSSPEYWGKLGSLDQRMVEMESIAYSLLLAPSVFLSKLSESGKGNLRTWLAQINDNDMPKNNWRWFRIFVNLALVKHLGVPAEQVQAKLDSDFALLDSFYMGEGWSSDGPWGEERKQADYYSGSFAIQFAQLLYVRFVDAEDERAKKYRTQAAEFAAKYWRYFDVNGAAIPFGRSLTYRFAFAAFWASAALAEVELPAPLDNPGVIKGLLLRHLRWWTRHTDMFNADGSLSIGFAYQNMYLSEDYNSPQSVYWCLKGFCALALPETHPFWSVEELPHPLADTSIPTAVGSTGPSTVEVVWPPRQILCSGPEHHFMLSSGQMSTRAFKAKQAKYGKFAYSSAFAFSVPTGLALHQVAPDSTLAASFDDGQTWAVRSKPEAVRLEAVKIVVDGESQTVSALKSVWKPWKFLDVDVETTLIPLIQQWPGWHARIHHVRWSGLITAAPWLGSLQIVDGGFAISSETAGRLFVPEVKPGSSTAEGWFKSKTDSLVRSRAGASGVVDLTGSLGLTSEIEKQSEALVIRPDPNTNLVASRTQLPSLSHRIVMTDKGEAWLASGVFAVAADAALSTDRVTELWLRRPQPKLAQEGETQVIVGPAKEGH